MRYYRIELTNPTSGAALKTYTSFVNNQTLPGALDIELDIPVVPFALPDGEGYIKIWGVSLAEISQASDLNGAAIKVYAGMQAGLPLANPKQAGLIAQGYVLQAFGNWINTEMSLDFILTASPTKVTPVNIVFDWKKGTPLSTAITNTLSTAYPDFSTPVVSINPNLVLKNDEPGAYQNLVQLAKYIKQKSASIVGGDYPGVDIRLTEKTFYVYDGTTEKKPTQIAFRDIIGQPTWIGPTSVQVKCVMRADIQVLDYIKFPAAQVTATQQPLAQLVNQKLTFQGTFRVTKTRHVGHARQADAASWVTVIDAVSTKPVDASQTFGQT